MQDDLNAEIKILEEKVQQQEDMICTKNMDIENLRNKTKEEEEEEDEKIKHLKNEIQEMSTEFAKMLRETLDKMSKRIQMANWDADNDPKFM